MWASCLSPSCPHTNLLENINIVLIDQGVDVPGGGVQEQGVHDSGAQQRGQGGGQGGTSGPQNSASCPSLPPQDREVGRKVGPADSLPRFKSQLCHLPAK